MTDSGAIQVVLSKTFQNLPRRWWKRKLSNTTPGFSPWTDDEYLNGCLWQLSYPLPLHTLTVNLYITVSFRLSINNTAYTPNVLARDTDTDDDVQLQHMFSVDSFGRLCQLLYYRRVSD